MNEKNIFIDLVGLRAKVEELKNERTKMEEVLGIVDKDFKGVGDYWKGNSGQKVQDYLREYSEDFPYILLEVNKAIEFLEKTIEKYETMDESINRKIDENIGVSMVGGGK